MRLLFSLLMMLLSSCTLAENEILGESKDYTGTIHNVEQADYEFEERLNSFYESETIDKSDLNNLYDGEFPNGEETPQRLRIHWQDARELALAELELQKEIQMGWNNATVSERPILILDDKGSKNFYRYYEYRVLSGNSQLGAIRIPAYRRTENFATAAVHIYSADEKTYTVESTGWGQYMAENSDFSSSEDFKKLVQSQIVSLVDDNVLYNFLYKFQEKNITQTYESLNKNLVYNTLTCFYNSKYDDANFHGKSFMSTSQFEYASKVMAAEDAEELAESISAGYQAIAVAESTAQLVDSMKDEMLGNFTDMYELSFIAFLKMLWVDMATRDDMNEVRMSSRDYYWTAIENLEYKNSLEYKQWNNAEIFDIYGLEPVLQFNNIDKFPKKQNISSDKKYLNYQVVSDDNFSTWTSSSLGIKSKNSSTTYRIYDSLKDLTVVDEYLTLESLSTSGNNLGIRTVSTSSSSDESFFSKLISALFDMFSSSENTPEIPEWLEYIMKEVIEKVFTEVYDHTKLKYDDLNTSRDLYNEYISNVNGTTGLKQALNDITEYLEYVEKYNIEIDSALKEQLEYQKLFLSYMDKYGKDYWIEMQLDMVEKWIIWITVIPVYWQTSWARLPKWMWYISLPIKYKDMSYLVEKFDPNFTIPETVEYTVENPIDSSYAPQWNYFYDWISTQKFLLSSDTATIDVADNTAYILDTAIDNMKEIYSRTLVTNTVIDIQTNEDGTTSTNKTLVESPITNDDKDQYFEEYVNGSLNTEVESRFGTTYKLDEFGYNF